jgi:hypothetical protein
MIQHLPDGTYWSCSDNYNGLSSIDKHRQASNRIIDFVRAKYNK